MKLKQVALLGSMLGVSSFAMAQDAPAEEKAVAPAAAKEEAKPEEAAKPVVVTTKDKMDKIIAKATAERNVFMKKLRAIKDRNEARAFYQKEQPDLAPTVQALLDLAKTDPTAKGVASGLAWGLTSCSKEQFKESMEIVMSHHIHETEMLAITSRLARMRGRGDSYLQKIRLYSNNEQVRQATTITLASGLVRSRSPEGKSEGLALFRTILAWPGIEKSNPRYYSAAKSAIFVAENLTIGKMVPDIVGTDEEGVEFKLSDYKGKVTLIDFWGIW